MTQSSHLAIGHSLLARFIAYARKHFGWTLSITVHVSLLFIALFLLSFPQPYSAQEGSISVDIVAHVPGSHNEKNTPSVNKSKGVENTFPPPPLPVPAPKAPPTPVEPPPTPFVRENEGDLVPESVKKPKITEKKTIADILNESKSIEDLLKKKPVAKQEVPPKTAPIEVEKKEAKQEKVFDLKAIENLLTQKKNTPVQAPPKGDRHGETTTVSPGLSERSSSGLSLAQRDALGVLFKEQLAQCWSIPVGLDMGNYKPEIVIHLDENGGLIGEPRVVNLPSDASSQALAHSALRAVRRCAPFRIPASFNSFYSEWRDWHITFDPKDFIG